VPHNILHLLGSAEEEGSAIANFTGMLAKRLDPAQYRIHAWFLGSDGPLVTELKRTGTLVRHIPWESGIRDPFGAFRFCSALSTDDFSIVHQHFGGRSPRLLVRARTRAKIITHLHGYIRESLGLRPVRGRVGADLVIAISRAVAEQVVGTCPRIIHPGVALPGHRALPARDGKMETVVGTAGRLVAIKGTIHLVRAIALLRSEFPDVRLEIAGTGPDLSALESEVRSLGLSDRVTFLGWQSDLSFVMLGWDIFVMPSLAEGLGVAVLEAMAHGLPVVASAVGGLREVVVDCETGLLVPCADPEALARQLGKLLRNSEKRLAMGTEAVKRIQKHFSAERMVMEVGRIYDELLGNL
jgi:glycosyltransferase involved in cell wall biosynthesis